jgi:hypothetical protein
MVVTLHVSRETCLSCCSGRIEPVETRGTVKHECHGRHAAGVPRREGLVVDAVFEHTTHVGDGAGVHSVQLQRGLLVV